MIEQSGSMILAANSFIERAVNASDKGYAAYMKHLTDSRADAITNGEFQFVDELDAIIAIMWERRREKKLGIPA
jgi:archaeosine-15-forming tRNA-guanine transglycosylase